MGGGDPWTGACRRGRHRGRPAGDVAEGQGPRMAANDRSGSSEPGGLDRRRPGSGAPARPLALHGDIPAPALIASGQLFDSNPTWPYLVTERVRGAAIREVNLGAERAAKVAADLGAIVRRLHTLSPPEAVEERQPLAALRDEAPARLRNFGLPEHLVEQVPDFLADAEPARTLVHGDITADHVFVDHDGLTAIIDWGDALVADRSYEIPAVYLDALHGDRRLLARFLDVANWPRAQLARRGLQGILEFQFNAISAIATHVDLSKMLTLDGLARHLFKTP